MWRIFGLQVIGEHSPALPCPTLSPAGSDLTLGTLKLAQRVGKLAKYAIRKRDEEGGREAVQERKR